MGQRLLFLNNGSNGLLGIYLVKIFLQPSSIDDHSLFYFKSLLSFEKSIMMRCHYGADNSDYMVEYKLYRSRKANRKKVILDIHVSNRILSYG